MEEIFKHINDINQRTHLDNLNKAFGTDKKHGEGKHIADVKVTREGKTFTRKQLVGFTDESRFSGEKTTNNQKDVSSGEKPVADIAKNKVKLTDVEKLKNYVLYGTDEKMKNIAIEELRNRGIKVRQPQWYDDINQKYQIKILPVGIEKKDVIFNNASDPHSEWIMKWEDPKSGKWKHSYSSEYSNRKSKIKFNRAVSMPDSFLDDVQSKAVKLIGDKDQSKHQAGLVLSIMAKTGLRVGDTSAHEKTGNEGVTTLSAKSVTIKGDTVHLDFIGKSHHRNVTDITDKKLATEMSKLLKDKKPDEMVFPDVSRQYIMNVFRDDFGYKDNVLKDIRTKVACDLAIKSLYGATPPPPLPDDNKKARKLIATRLTDAFKVVSEQLNNSPTMAKNSYVNPIIIADWMNKIGGDDIMKAVHDKIDIPTLKDICERNKKLCELPVGIYESDYLADESDLEEDGSDVLYPMPKWMEDLFEEFE